MNDVDLVGTPLDLGAGRRGVDLGPSAFRIANVSYRIAALGYSVNDQGYIPVQIPEVIGVQNQRARYAKEIGEVCGSLGDAALHLSFDMDGVDPAVAPGVGTPVRGGLFYREAHLVMEMVEVNPVLDHQNSPAVLGCELILSALGKKIL
jgi:arginase family enzyme